MITSFLCMIDKMTLKTLRASSILWERRQDADCTVPTVFSTFPKSTGHCQLRLPPWAFVLSGEPLDKHPFTGPKLGCMTPNKLAQKQTEDLIINSCTTAIWYLIKMPKIHIEGKRASSTNGIGKKYSFSCRRMKSELYSSSCTIFNSQCIKGLTMKTEMQKLLAKYNVLQTSRDRLPFVPELKPVPDKRDLKKQASFHTAKETISQVEKSHTVRENLCQLPQTEN